MTRGTPPSGWPRSPSGWTCRAGAAGRLFGSVSASDIATAVRKAGGPELDRRRIEVTTPIRTVGTHQVTVRLHPEVTAALDVEVSGN